MQLHAQLGVIVYIEKMDLQSSCLQHEPELLEGELAWKI